ncbi:DUF1707 domain-containing protein [Nocardia sp. NPDC024068]|uniref:DUF1707 SHOCT-like domain-containing protein n=1 Tax=Nocardia sp. NPDC024068 TaxID=3157197 RepID=UPI0033D14EB5
MARTQQVRARDNDRVEVCALLDSALADGQLTTAEHTARTRSAMRAKFAHDLDALIRDLQIPGELAGAAILRRDRTSRRWWLPVAVLVAAAVIGAVAGLARPGATAGTTGTGPDTAAVESGSIPSPVTGSGLAFFIGNYREEFGDTIADKVELYPERVVVQRLEQGATRVYEFDADGFHDENSSLSSYAEGRPIDLSTLDLPVVAGVLAGAVASAGLETGAVAEVEIGYELIAPEDAGPVIDIHVEGASGAAAAVKVSMSGRPMEVDPAP